MAIFETGVQQASAVNTSAGVIWDVDNTSTTTYGPLGSVTTGAVLKDLLIMNTGTATCYVGGASVTGATNGTPVNPGGYLLIGGYSITAASGTTGDLSAITASGTTYVTVGLASVVSAV